MPSLTDRLLSVVRRPVGAPCRQIAATHVLDWIGSCVAAEHSGFGRPLRALTTGAPGGPATTFVSGSVDAATAAYVNAALALALEMDSTSRTARAHPGPGVIGAALAVGQQQRATGPQFLDAVVRGYEAMIRLGEAGGSGHYQLFHSTSTWGSAGAAIAAADLLGLDVGATLDALGNSLSRTGGVWQCRPERTATKLVHVGESTSSGIRAALLAGAGVSGPRLILEGELGLFAAICPDPDPDAVDRDPAGPWRIVSTSLKPWPGCRHAHPAVTAALKIRDELRRAGVRPDQVESIHVRTYSEAISFADNPSPTTAQEAMFSIQHLVARALQYGTLTLADTRPDAMSDRATRRLAERVLLSAGAEEDSRYPEHWGARLEVRWSPTGQLAAEVADALGDPEDPMDAAAVATKVRSLLTTAGVEDDLAAELVSTVAELPDSTNLDRLSRALARMPGCQL